METDDLRKNLFNIAKAYMDVMYGVLLALESKTQCSVLYCLVCICAFKMKWIDYRSFWSQV